jgi:hypothetical protein
MSSKYNKNKGQIKIDKSAVIAYDKKDPRYHLTIEDSDEYIKNIYPLHFKKKCHNSQEFEKLVKYDWPLISRCWGEGYENCAVLQKYGKTCNNKSKADERPIIEAGHCSCSRCAMTLYDTIEDTLGYAKVDLRSNIESNLNSNLNSNQNLNDELNDELDDVFDDLDSNFTSDKSNLDRTNFEKKNRNSIYDRTRVMIDDNIHIDKTPAVKRCGSSMSVNKAGNGLEYNLEAGDKYQNYKSVENFGNSDIISARNSTLTKIGLNKTGATIIIVILILYLSCNRIAFVNPVVTGIACLTMVFLISALYSMTLKDDNKK